MNGSNFVVAQQSVSGKMFRFLCGHFVKDIMEKSMLVICDEVSSN